MNSSRCAFVVAIWLCLAGNLAHGQSTIPASLSNDAFRKLIDTVSEPGGPFIFGNLTSNEPYYPNLIRDLKKTTKPGGVFIGVGPEQNFSYIAALKPRMAFVVDIRRQNMIELLMYQALFEQSATRLEFLSRLFSRKRPPGIRDESTIQEIMDSFGAAAEDTEAFRKNLDDIRSGLAIHGFTLTAQDQADLERIFRTFAEWGTQIRYTSDRSSPPRGGAARTSTEPTYAADMTATDSDGRQWSYLSSEENYRFVRDMEMRNMIVPIVGDFAGPKAIRAIGQYLNDHASVVTTFYVSSVETYLFPASNGQPYPGAPNGGWESFVGNVSALPLNASSMFVRFLNVTMPGRLDSMQSTLTAAKEGKIMVLRDLFPGAP